MKQKSGREEYMYNTNSKKKKSNEVAVKLTFTHYEEHLAPVWSEHDPSLRVFLDQNFKRRPVEFKLDPNNPKANYSINISGILKEDTLSDMAAIGLKSYVTTNNANGEPCRVSAGSDFIYLKEISERLKTYGKFEKWIELRLHSVQNFEKGKIKVTVSREDLHIGENINFCPPKAIQACFIDGKFDKNVVSKKILEYIGKTIEAKNELKEKDPRTTKIRVPAYMGDPGLELTNGVPLPAALFVMFEVPEINVLFLENAVDRVMAREGWTKEEFPHLSRAEQCEILKSVVCYVAQYMPYIGDTVDMNTRHARYNKALKKGCENFEGGLERGSGDCEDLEQTIMATVSALRALCNTKFDVEELSVAAKAVQDMSREYISGMSLDSVTSGAVTGANDRAAQLGAHMNLNLFPTEYFKECLERESPEVSKELPWERIKLGDGKNVFKVAEGTGMYYSEDHIKDTRYVNSYLYHESCFATFKKPIFHKQGTHSPFYREGLTLFVPEFAQLGSNYIGFWYCNAEGYRGAPFEDLENLSNKVHIRAQPKIPDDVMAISKEAIKIRSPPMPLVLTSLSSNKTHKQADRIVNAINKLGRTTKNHFPPAILYTTVNMLQENDTNVVIDTLIRKQGVLNVKYTLEDVCDTMPVGIRFEIYADPSMDEAFMIR